MASTMPGGHAGGALPLGRHTAERGLHLVPVCLLAIVFHGATDALAVGVEADQMSTPGHHAPRQDSAAWPPADAALEPLTWELRGREGGREGGEEPGGSVS